MKKYLFLFLLLNLFHFSLSAARANSVDLFYFRLIGAPNFIVSDSLGSNYSYSPSYHFGGELGYNINSKFSLGIEFGTHFIKISRENISFFDSFKDKYAYSGISGQEIDKIYDKFFTLKSYQEGDNFNIVSQDVANAVPSAYVTKTTTFSDTIVVPQNTQNFTFAKFKATVDDAVYTFLELVPDSEHKTGIMNSIRNFEPPANATDIDKANALSRYTNRLIFEDNQSPYFVYDSSVKDISAPPKRLVEVNSHEIIHAFQNVASIKVHPKSYPILASFRYNVFENDSIRLSFGLGLGISFVSGNVDVYYDFKDAFKKLTLDGQKQYRNFIGQKNSEGAVNRNQRIKVTESLAYVSESDNRAASYDVLRQGVASSGVGEGLYSTLTSQDSTELEKWFAKMFIDSQTEGGGDFLNRKYSFKKEYKHKLDISGKAKIAIDWKLSSSVSLTFDVSANYLGNFNNLEVKNIRFFDSGGNKEYPLFLKNMPIKNPNSSYLFTAGANIGISFAL